MSNCYVLNHLREGKTPCSLHNALCPQYTPAVSIHGSDVPVDGKLAQKSSTTTGHFSRDSYVQAPGVNRRCLERGNRVTLQSKGHVTATRFRFLSTSIALIANATRRFPLAVLFSVYLCSIQHRDHPPNSTPPPLTINSGVRTEVFASLSKIEIYERTI